MSHLGPKSFHLSRSTAEGALCGSQAVLQTVSLAAQLCGSFCMLRGVHAVHPVGFPRVRELLLQLIDEAACRHQLLFRLHHNICD